MSKEFKSLSLTNIKAESKGRVRVGVCAVFGNVDSWGDRINAGAFAKTILEGKGRVRHLWNHDSSLPPIASIKELRELTREELPAEVLAKAPDATGGLLVSREYYPADKSPLAEMILHGIDVGDINEMSFAYDVVKSAYVTEPIEGTDRSREIRELQELRIYDTSDVNWGMNGATVAVGAKNAAGLPLGLIYSNLLQIKEQMTKAGRRNSETDQTLIDLIHKTAIDLGAVCEKAEDEPKSSDSTETPKAEAAGNSSTSLSPNWLELQRLELDNL